MIRLQQVAVHKPVLHDQVAARRHQQGIRLDLGGNVGDVVRRSRITVVAVAVDQPGHMGDDRRVDRRALHEVDPAPENVDRPGLVHVVVEVDGDHPAVGHDVFGSIAHIVADPPTNAPASTIRSGRVSTISWVTRVEGMLQRQDAEPRLAEEDRPLGPQSSKLLMVSSLPVSGSRAGTLLRSVACGSGDAERAAAVEEGGHSYGSQQPWRCQDQSSMM